MPSTPPTAKELIAELSKVDPDTPVIVSTHYDNDIGHASEISVRLAWMEPTEASYWEQVDVADLRAAGEPIPDDAVRAVVITASGG